MGNNSLIRILLFMIVIASCSPANIPFPTVVISSSATPNSTTITPIKTLAIENIIIDAALSTDGSLLIVFSNTGIYLYDTTSLDKTIIKEFNDTDYQQPYPELRPGAVAMSPNGEVIAISGKTADTPILLLNIDTGESISSIQVIPNGYYVTQLQFSPKGEYLYVRSEYPRSIHCTHNGIDTSFALHKLDMDATRQYDTKVFEKQGCINMSPYSKVRFTNNGEFFLYMEQDMSSPLVYIVNTGFPSDIKEYTVNENLLPYDIESNGKYYAIYTPSDNGQILTTIIDTESSSTMAEIPYMVKLLDGKDRYLVRGDIYNESEWGLWENGKIVCYYDKIIYPFHFIWELSANNEVFISFKSNKEIIIWDVATCLARNILSLND